MRVYDTLINPLKGFAIRCTFINPFFIFYSADIFYSVPEILNSFDTEIVFKNEEESNNSIAFLDILITRTPSNSPKNFLSTTIYRKTTYTGLRTKWQSFVSKSYKVSVMSSMVYMAIKICSSFKLMHDEFEFIKSISMKNEYPKNFIETQIRKSLGRYYDKNNGTKIYSQNK